MKGVIFTNFLEMVDDVFSPEVTEQIIEKADVPSGASYTSVGAYDHGEILALVTQLSEITGENVPTLVRAFGKYLFHALGKAHPEYVKDVENTFQLLHRVHNHIHVEVRKLYPDAELPTIACEEDEAGLTVTYHSDRPFADVAEGLIAGCIDHFGEAIDFSKTQSSDDGRSAVFRLEHAA